MTVILKIRFYICPCLRMKKNKTMKKNCFLLLFLLCACLVQAQDTYRTDKDVPYISGSETDAYRLERCKLDVYYPENKKDFSTIVWFHGGGMEGGSKFVPRELTDQGFAVVADQIGKLAADSAKSAVNTRDLIDKTLVEIENGNTITRTTADAFNQIIADMESFAEIAQNTMEKANSQAESLEQIGQGIEQLSGVVQGNAASSEENTAISVNLAEGAAKMQDRVKIFKLF